MNWMARIYCLRGDMRMVIPLVLSDLIIFLDYVVIPVAILKVGLALYDRYPRIRHLIWWACAFILSCGITHFLDVCVMWRGDVYLALVVWRAVTALVSTGAAIAYWQERRYLSDLAGGHDSRNRSGSH